MEDFEKLSTTSHSKINRTSVRLGTTHDETILGKATGVGNAPLDGKHTRNDAPVNHADRHNTFALEVP